MVSKERQKKLDYVKAIHNDYTIVIAKHPRFEWVNHSESKFIYFLYITKSQKCFVDKNTAHVGEFNILCFQNFYSSFISLMKVIVPILAEYILDNDELFKIIMLCEELEDPDEEPLHEKDSDE
ncbi:hypothetical protein RRV45_01095 [Bacillus sp. DTU_2020_1000418_1_SI_GHA_SEK_038]|uniref:hypothetical protein n=1 Tax=Bacillus sp. DTU_2020_1000418_1_SI_GHA_SEK_038 TaxID=3077585 RepID=UPI0028E7791B|nr:hypothetical protein [Bacillus sp. DTU_2020_1000418_1_SI_GHA_SEK_038]WNS75675.1 hypothetical protein RRV45_01095 [Bacillus sp. DTU_2020_1000418_1_SI_GHA_SEK_038]